MREPVWEYLIVNYLFLGGLSAGLFFVSALATWLTNPVQGGPPVLTQASPGASSASPLTPAEDSGQALLLSQNGEPAYPRIARWGALLAPWPVSAGSALLIFDLGKPLRFWKLFIAFRWQSPMSIGSWLLVLFTLLSFAYLWAWLDPEERTRLMGRIPAKLLRRIPTRIVKWLEHDLAFWRRELAMMGFPMAVGVGIYTGVLLGAVQARPFWNTNLVAQMFLFSALSTGTATLILVRLFDRKQPVALAEMRFLYTLDICLILIEFFIVLPYLIHGRLSVLAVQDALHQILGGPFTFAFWGLFLGLGLLAPLLIELYEFKPVLLGRGQLHISPRWATSAAGLVILGGYVLRYVFVFAGQASGFR